MSAIDRGDLSKQPLARSSFRFGLPLALAMMGHGLFNLVDLVIVGQLEAGAIAAVTIPGILLTVLMLMFDGVSNATVALTSQGRGAGRWGLVHEVAWESFWLATFTGIVGGGVLWFLAHPLMKNFGLNDPQVINDGTEYFKALALGLVTMFLIMQITSVLRGVGNSFWPVVILVGSNVLNVVLDLVFVFGWWGCPEMGVVGAAWATVVARGAGVVLGLWLLWRGCGGVCLKTYKFNWRFRHGRTLCFVGLPTAVQLAVRVLAWAFLLRIATMAESVRSTALGLESATEALVDGIGICIRLEMIAVLVGLGWGAAGTTVVGQNLGARRVRRAYRGTWYMISFAVVSMALLGALLWLFRRPLFEGIEPDLDQRGLQRGFEYLKVTVPYYPVMAVSFVISRALNGAGSSKTPFFIDFILFFLLLIPAASYLSGAGVFGIGADRPPDPNGAWHAVVVMHAISALAYGIVWQKGHWRRKRLREQAERSSAH